MKYRSALRDGGEGRRADPRRRARVALALAALVCVASLSSWGAQSLAQGGGGTLTPEQYAAARTNLEKDPQAVIAAGILTLLGQAGRLTAISDCPSGPNCKAAIHQVQIAANYATVGSLAILDPNFAAFSFLAFLRDENGNAAFPALAASWDGVGALLESSDAKTRDIGTRTLTQLINAELPNTPRNPGPPAKQPPTQKPPSSSSGGTGGGGGGGSAGGGNTGGGGSGGGSTGGGSTGGGTTGGGNTGNTGGGSTGGGTTGGGNTGNTGGSTGGGTTGGGNSGNTGGGSTGGGTTGGGNTGGGTTG